MNANGCKNHACLGAMAVSALLSLNVFAAHEIWLVPGAAVGGTGTASDPYRVPSHDAEAFDARINAAPPNTTIRLGAGHYLTNGNVAGSTTQVLLVKDGSHLIGSGIGNTVIRMRPGAAVSNYAWIIQCGTSGPEAKTSQSVRELTIDCNFGAQGAETLTCGGISYVGYHNRFENVEIIGLGGRNAEGFGIFGGAFRESEAGLPSHVVIKGCRVRDPWTGTGCYVTAIHPSGSNGWTGYVEGCYVDHSPANYPVSGAYGIAFAGSPAGLTISGNTVVGCTRGIHVDTVGTYEPSQPRGVIIANNTTRECRIGIAVGGAGEAASTDAGFENFVIEGNSISMSGGSGIFLSGRCSGFQVKNNVIIATPETASTAYCLAIELDLATAGNVIEGNRYGPRERGRFWPIKPVSYDPTSAPAINNMFHNNSWISDRSVPTVLKGYRLSQTGNPMPAGSSYWEFDLGSAQAENMPTTQLWSSDLNGGNDYCSARFSRNNGWEANGYNTWFDPAGTSGVWIGSQKAGNLGVAGWIHSNTGVYIPSASMLVVEEANGSGRMGTVTLQNGSAVVTTTAVRQNSRIFLTPQEDGGVAGAVRVASRVPSQRFVIRSTSAQDQSRVAWLIIEPSP